MSISLIVMGASGRMGSTLVRLIAAASDLELVAVVEPKLELLPPMSCAIAKTLPEIIEDFPSAIIIDFTAPVATMENVRLATKYRNPYVIGTTGLNIEDKQELAILAKENLILFSPNMSIGVNVLLDILPKLTAMLGSDYDVDLMEIHHNMKKDAPSGTALRLAEAVAEGRHVPLEDVACYHREGIIGERPQGEIGIQTLRGGDIVGVHTVYYMGTGERIEVTHHAHSRENFAGGALRAARWLHTQKCGQLFSMRDVLARSNEA